MLIGADGNGGLAVQAQTVVVVKGDLVRFANISYSQERIEKSTTGRLQRDLHRPVRIECCRINIPVTLHFQCAWREELIEDRVERKRQCICVVITSVIRDGVSRLDAQVVASSTARKTIPAWINTSSPGVTGRTIWLSSEKPKSSFGKRIDATVRVKDCQEGIELTVRTDLPDRQRASSWWSRDTENIAIVRLLDDAWLHNESGRIEC